MIEIMIMRKNRLEPILILQSVNDGTNCKRNQKQKHFFSVFIKYTQLVQTRLNPGIKNSRNQGSSFAKILGSRIKIKGLNVGSVGKKYTLLRPWNTEIPCQKSTKYRYRICDRSRLLKAVSISRVRLSQACMHQKSSSDITRKREKTLIGTAIEKPGYWMPFVIDWV